MGPGFVSPLDKNMGALIYLHMGSWTDSTLNRRQTVASAKKGSDRASGSSLKRSRRGQMRQVRQMRGRFKSTKLPQISKLSRFSLSFERGRCGRCGRCFKTFPPTKEADSPKLIQANSTQHIP